ncbi:hypothetical protein CHS0354_005610 [Potamilus streckersoni]|uniref:Uncharacterized protein n=1 Tax=Potamilus streckersoni TaxID=2493646 RepID=A0AAE0SIG5_9BIVA|nr:hypothetical protein CHS0354_005610 [Potamilus streckersoni]
MVWDEYIGLSHKCPRIQHDISADVNWFRLITDAPSEMDGIPDTPPFTYVALKYVFGPNR